MNLHAEKFPRIWAYLDKSGKTALMLGRSFDMFGRRRLFPEPTWELAKERFIEDNEEKLRLDENEALQKIALYRKMTGNEPGDQELYDLSHRTPTGKEISKTQFGMKGSIERQGKNPCYSGNQLYHHQAGDGLADTIRTAFRTCGTRFRSTARSL